MIEKNIIDKSKNRKRKNTFKTDDNGPVSKKLNTNDVEERDFQISNIKIEEVKIEKDNEETNNTKIKENKEMSSIEKSTVFKKKNSKVSKIKKVGKRRPGDDSMMFLDAERLKTYGINAKKLKNKLKYGKKRFNH